MLSLPPDPCPPNRRVSSPPCSTFTFGQSASSSSVAIIGSAVSTPCPISGCLFQIVIVPSGSILTNPFGWNDPVVCDCPTDTSNPPAAETATRRNSRRLIPHPQGGSTFAAPGRPGLLLPQSLGRFDA